MKAVKRNILLNPGPATTQDAVKYAMVVPDICPREQEFCDLMDSIKIDLPRVVNGHDTYTSVLFAASGTGAVEATITSAVPADGKLLVIINGAYGERMADIARRFGIEVVAYQLSYGDYPDISQIEAILTKDPAIGHIALADHETTTGMRNPVAEICRVAHALGREVIVDAMSSYAGLPIDLQEWNCEYLISSSNKCIQGMAGLSFVIFRKDKLESLARQKRSYYFDIYEQYNGFRKTGQMRFTPPVQVVYALRKALDLFFEETAEGRISRYRENYEILRDGLMELGFRFLLPDEHQSGILLAIIEPEHPAYNYDHMHDVLYARGFTIYPGKGAKENTFRLSILGDLHPADIREFLSALRDYISNHLPGFGSLKPSSNQN
jgi:2-aminoethylphosphonate aminotransferase